MQDQVHQDPGHLDQGYVPKPLFSGGFTPSPGISCTQICFKKSNVEPIHFPGPMGNGAECGLL